MALPYAIDDKAFSLKNLGNLENLMKIVVQTNNIPIFLR
jgi:hypothetical protein